MLDRNVQTHTHTHTNRGVYTHVPMTDDTQVYIPTWLLVTSKRAQKHISKCLADKAVDRTINAVHP